MQNLGMVGGAIIGSGFGPMGAASGAALGAAVGKGIGYLTGSGDYRLKSGGSVPSFSKNESTVVTHREYITDVFSGPGIPSAFKITKLPLNPGDPSTFPWLSAIAGNYEEYELLGVVFEFISTSGDSVGSTTTSLGTVILATQYDPTKPSFDTKQGMENHFFSQSSKPSNSILHAIECKKSQTPVKTLYIRSGDNDADLRWTDFGNFYIATVGMQAPAVNLGELWVSYKVKLMKPRLPRTVGIGSGIASTTTFNLGCTSGFPLGVGFNYKGTLQATNTANTISWKINPASVYLVTIAWVSVTSATPILATATTNCVLHPGFRNATDSGVGGGFGTAFPSFSQTFLSTTTGGGDQFATITTACVIVGSCNVVIAITQLDDTFGQDA